MSWTVPPPPPPPSKPPIRTGRVFGGIGIAFGAQVVAVLIGVGIAAAVGFAGLWVEIVLQVLLCIACIVFGTLWIAHRDRGIGLGVLIGWGISVLVFPVIGIGVCIALINNQGTV
ncbi:hypothetical protein Dvina_07970 [Dactylosporangium vinaceum]|uniref:DUF4190 domain-containing protein n=1 Tax=Dactylosporangium vinaceum TaxID=53362 RepID=A0ABV5M6Z6_9ACTN|nr:hypothetical protein [Dactylosporangium vinaceum]UAB98028.1 hypothetical protein Dvina_07970 [Dactylosporangium vinaceum]